MRCEKDMRQVARGGFRVPPFAVRSWKNSPPQMVVARKKRWAHLLQISTGVCSSVFAESRKHATPKRFDAVRTCPVGGVYGPLP